MNIDQQESENTNILSPETQTTLKSKEELEQELKKDAKEWFTLSKSYKQNKYYKEETEGYLLNKIWLRKWKRYVDYKFVKDQLENSYRINRNQQYSIVPEEFPGPIDNNFLLVDKSTFYNDGNENDFENQVIKHDIDQANELRIVNKEMWEFLYKRFSGGPVLIKPKIEEETKYNKRKVFEVYYGKYQLLLLPDRSILSGDNEISRHIPEVKNLYISRTKDLNALKEKIVNVALSSTLKTSSLTSKNIRLWRYSGSISTEQISETINSEKEALRSNTKIKIHNLNYLEYIPNFLLSEFDVEDVDTIIVESNCLNPESNEFDSNWILDIPQIEMKKAKCDWCNTVKYLKIHCQCKEVWYCSETCKIRDVSFHENHCKKKFEISDSDIKMTDRSRKGIVGLQNLGNTCFMNSSLQCIANCYELALYFLKDYYKKDINTDNPLGTQGALARSFANLLKELYYGESHSFSPRHFKKAIGTFQPMFSGYQQHDTQEFVNYLLDGLHEDLNRVVKKPFIEKDESQKEDHIKAREQWIGFLRRNQSVLVSFLYGQYKSTITCPCSYVSTTFDPYMSISLPLANRVQPYEVTCYFIFYDLSIIPIQLNLLFNTKTTIMALRNKIAKIMDIHPFSFLVTKMDQKGSIDTLCHSKTLLIKPSSLHHNNQKAYFLFQINPQIFSYSTLPKNETYNTDYKNIIEYLKINNERNKKIFDDNYEEEENCNTFETENYYSTSNYNMRNTQEKAIIKYNRDNNYGFSEDYLITQLYMFGISNIESLVTNRSRLIFPRLIMINKKWDTETLYRHLFSYFYPQIKKQLSSNLQNTVHAHNLTNDIIEDEDKLYAHFYNDYKTDPSTDYNAYYAIKNIPFRIYINTHYRSKDRVNVFTGEAFSETGISNNEGYVLISKDTTLIEDYTNKIPFNKDLPIDNSYLFMSDNNKFYSNIKNSDFYFQISWHVDYSDGVKKLNDKVDFEFKITKKLKDSIDLDECFKQFCKEEQLEENNEWYCSSCKQHVKAKVHMELYSTPPVLIIHLKRFKAHQKIDTQVEFPIENLDMSKYIIGPKNGKNVYDLFAVAHHYGGMGGGHYVASAKNHFDGRWYNFNDSSVSQERIEDITSSSAYVLYYKHKEFKDIINCDEVFNAKFVDYSSEDVK